MSHDLEKKKTERVAVVTGGNRGIGYSITKNLAKAFNGTVYLTARREQQGMEAVRSLAEQGLNVKYHQLDIDDMESIKRFELFLRKTHGGLDVLINNAAVISTDNPNKSLKDQVSEVIRINYFGTLNLCNELFPLLRKHARVVHVSSAAGLVYFVRNEYFRNKMMKPNLTISEINAIMREAQEHLVQANYETYLLEAYEMSKSGINALTREQQRLFDSNQPDKDILVAAVHPGEVITDMNPIRGTISADRASETIVYLALQPPHTHLPKGAFWFQKKTYDWANPNFNLSVFNEEEI